MEWHKRNWRKLLHVCDAKVHLIINYKSIGINISERKSGTERTKKREFIFFPSQGGATGTIVHRLNATRTKSQKKHTQFYKQIHGTIKWWSCITKHTFRIINVPLPSTGRWLPSHLSSTWSWAERIERVFPTRNTHKKAGHFKWKARWR